MLTVDFLESGGGAATASIKFYGDIKMKWMNP